MKKAILFGTYTAYEYHPLKGVDDEIKSILGTEYDVTPTEDMEIFNQGTLAKLDLLILYADKWNKAIDSRHMAAMLAFVAMGGRLLVIHNGISFQDNFEFMQMVGGKFDYHPEIRNLSFRTVGEHPLATDIPNFEVFDEPYQFEFCSHTPRKVFLEYEMEGAKYPAGWTVDYCLGKVVYLMPGHNTDSFKNETYRKLIIQAADWLLHDKGTGEQE